MSEHVLDPPGQDITGDLRRYGFCVEPDRADGNVILRLHGELDVATAPSLDKALTAAFDTRPSAVTLDLRELTFVDSTGIRTFIAGSRHASPIRCSFILRSPRPAVHRALRLIGIDQLIAIDTDSSDL